MVAQPSSVSERQDIDVRGAAVDPARLKAAVRNGELELRYQPEVDLLTGEIVALEGLIRWSCPGAGPVSPQDFLPLAQQLGLMPTIDSWVLETGAAQAAVWRDDYGQNRLLWLNVSMDSVLDEAFVYRIIGILDRHALPAGELGLEISERVLLRLGDDAEDLLNQLRELGLALVVDDFSSYDSALELIASLPVDGVKLSHHFVRGPGTADQETCVRAIVDQAHAKGMYVVAEGVETAEEAARLARLGCDRAHGYLFASAQRPDRAAWMLEQGFGWRGATWSPDAPTVTRT